MTNFPSDLIVKPVATEVGTSVSSATSSNSADGLFETREAEVTTSVTGQAEDNSYTPYTRDSLTQPNAVPVSGEMPNTKDEQSVMSFFHLYGDIEDYEFKKDKNGNITDVYRKNPDYDSSYRAERFSLRYDSNGNMVKSFVQDIDENGTVLGQEVTNYNADGSKQNTIYYRYEFDEEGNKTGQIRKAYDAQYGDELSALSACGLDASELPPLIFCNCIPPIGTPSRGHAQGVENVQRTQDGKITELTYNGVRYCLRYDSEGNLIKTFTQKFDENGKITNQDITHIKPDGTEILEKHTYDENGVDNTSEAQKAINRVVAMYATKSGDISQSEDAMNKFNAFINNNTMAKLKAAGISDDEVKTLLEELFKNLDSKLYNKQFLGTEEEKSLIAKYIEQYQQIFGVPPMLVCLN